MRAVGLLLEFLGFVSVVVGATLVATWLGWIIGGFVLLLIGNSLDRSGA